MTDLLRRRGTAIAALAALVVGRAVWYAVQGANFVLDDWSLAGYRHFNGQMTDVFLRSRPGAWAVNTVLFGVADRHPLVLFALVTALFLLATVALYLVMRRFLAPLPALAVAAVWVLMPNHNTLALWGATMPTLAALSLLLLGLLALTHGRWVLGAVLLIGSVLTYELFVPLCLLAPFVAPGPLQRAPAERAVQLWQRFVVAGAVVAATAYLAADPLYPRELRIPDPVVFWSGHFGTGLFASADPPAILRLGVAGAIAVGVLVCLVAWVRGDRSRDTGPALVVAGGVVMALGAWVGFTLPLGSYGQNDRLFAATSIGAALVMVGIARFAWDRSGAADPSHRPARLAVGAGGALFVALCLVGQHISLGSWIQAGDDAVAAMHYIEANSEGDPGASHFVIGPTRIYRNAVSGLQDGDGKWALRLTFGDEGGGTLRIPDTPDGFAPQTDDEVLVEWGAIVPNPPPYAPAEP